MGPFARDDRHLAIGKIGDRPGVGDHGREVTGQKHLVLAVAHGEPSGVADAHADKLAGLLPAHGDDGMGPRQSRSRQARRLFQRGALGQVAFDQVRNDLSVRPGAEPMTVGNELLS